MASALIAAVGNSWGIVVGDIATGVTTTESVEIDNVVALVVLDVTIVVVVKVTVGTANGQQSGLSFTQPIKAA